VVAVPVTALAFIHIGEALGSRDKRSRAHRRAIGDPVNERLT
jgi:hypothetical protein